MWEGSSDPDIVYYVAAENKKQFVVAEYQKQFVVAELALLSQASLTTTGIRSSFRKGENCRMIFNNLDTNWE